MGLTVKIMFIHKRINATHIQPFIEVTTYKLVMWWSFTLAFKDFESALVTFKIKFGQTLLMLHLSFEN